MACALGWGVEPNYSLSPLLWRITPMVESWMLIEIKGKGSTLTTNKFPDQFAIFYFFTKTRRAFLLPVTPAVWSLVLSKAPTSVGCWRGRKPSGKRDPSSIIRGIRIIYSPASPPVSRFPPGRHPGNFFSDERGRITSPFQPALYLLQTLSLWTHWELARGKRRCLLGSRGN